MAWHRPAARGRLGGARALSLAYPNLCFTRSPRPPSLSAALRRDLQVGRALPTRHPGPRRSVPGARGSGPASLGAAEESARSRGWRRPGSWARRRRRPFRRHWGRRSAPLPPRATARGAVGSSTLGRCHRCGGAVPGVVPASPMPPQPPPRGGGAQSLRPAPPLSRQRDGQAQVAAPAVLQAALLPRQPRPAPNQDAATRAGSHSLP